MNQVRHYKGLLSIAGLLCLGLFTFHQINRSSSPSVIELTGQTMGTSYSIKIDGRVSQQSHSSLQDRIESRLYELDKVVFSTYHSESEVSRFNRTRAGESLSISDDFLNVYQLSLLVFEQSEGLFDVSIDPLVKLWGFGPGFDIQTIPTDSQIALARAQLGFPEIRTEPNFSTLSKIRETQLDFSAIAKGYAVDAVGLLLENAGIESYLVEIGGEVLSYGAPSPGAEWLLAIERPQAGLPQVQQVFSFGEAKLASATSGNYRNYFEMDGEFYSHEIDPRTGWPVKHSLLSVTVIHEQAALADAYATAMMIMGAEEVEQFADEYGLPVYFILGTPSGPEARYNTRFEPFLR